MEALLGLIFIGVIIGLIHHSVTRCPACGGSGIWTISLKGHDGRVTTHKTGLPCPFCAGMGKKR